MSDPLNNPRPHDESAFGELLRREAKASHPDFSERLHQDICHAVRQSQADQVSLPLINRGVTQRRWASLAVAAAVVLAIFWGWQSGSFIHVLERGPIGPEPSPVVAAHMPATPSLPGLMDRAALEVDRLISEKLVTEQWAYLEHDALVLANAVTGGSLRRFVPPAVGAPATDLRRPQPGG
jgi:hypothetical protein